jgi:hypothetical protein
VDKRRIAFVICFFMGKKVHREPVRVCGANVMTVQRVRKWRREFDSGRVNVMDEQMSGSDVHVC